MIVLDTHVLIWYLDGREQLSEKASAVLKEAVSRRAVNVSSISAWEIYMLTKKGRLELRIPVATWMERVERLSFIHFIPVDNEIERLSVDLSDTEPADPADRIIIATAQSLGLPLVTADTRIRKVSAVEAIW